MAAFPPLLFTVTTAVLLCGALTGEADIGLQHIALMLLLVIPKKHSQVPRKLFATSKATKTAPISPSPGTLWMATTAPATSITSTSTTGRDLATVAIVHPYTSLIPTVI